MLCTVSQITEIFGGESTLPDIQPAYYESMQVWEQDSPSLVVFDANDLRDTEFRGSYLGAVVEDAPLVSCTMEGAASSVLCQTLVRNNKWLTLQQTTIPT